MEIDELEILLKLNGGTRLPYLEDEIFANECLTILYLQLLTIHRLNLLHDTNISSLDELNCKVIDPGESWLDIEMQAWAAYYYTEEILNQRWLAAETIIYKSCGANFWGDSYAALYTTLIAGYQPCSL